jgi:DNA repair/transcription protein MET18/MMS19
MFRVLTSLQDLQIRPQSQRFQILELLHGLMSNHRKALLGLGDEFVIGVTDLVSGEKDPRNLMIVFSILHAIMVEWDISQHAEVSHSYYYKLSIILTSIDVI